MNIKKKQLADILLKKKSYEKQSINKTIVTFHEEKNATNAIS